MQFYKSAGALPEQLLAVQAGRHVAGKCQNIAGMAFLARDFHTLTPLFGEALKVFRARSADTAPINRLKAFDRAVNRAADGLLILSEGLEQRSPELFSLRFYPLLPCGVALEVGDESWPLCVKVRSGATSNGRSAQPACTLMTPRGATPCRTPSS